MSQVPSCSTCAWYRCERMTLDDYEGTTVTYRHVCYRQSGSPEVRTQSNTDAAPPACCDHYAA